MTVLTSWKLHYEKKVSGKKNSWEEIWTRFLLVIRKVLEMVKIEDFLVKTSYLGVT